MQILGRIFCENRRITSDTMNDEKSGMASRGMEEEKAELMLRVKDVIRGKHGCGGELRWRFGG